MTTDTTQNIKAQKRDAKGHLLPAVRDTPTLAILQAVNDTFRAIRERHPEVPAVAVVLGASGRRGQTMSLGHFQANNWESKTAKHELAISGEALATGPEEVLVTLLHESAHALAQARKINDTSRQGRFHNKRFKAVAEELGIVVEHSKSIGWSDSKLGVDTVKDYKAELATLRKALKAYRLPDATTKTPKKTVRVECDCRGLTVPIKFFIDGGITCDLCGEKFEDPDGVVESLTGIIAPLLDNGWTDENEDDDNAND